MNLKPEIIEAMPFEGVVANSDPKIWSKNTYKTLDLFPDRFFENVPMDVLGEMRPGTFTKLNPQKTKVTFG